MSNPKLSSIYIITFCSFIGLLCSYYPLSNNLKKDGNPPDYIEIYDETGSIQYLEVINNDSMHFNYVDVTADNFKSNASITSEAICLRDTIFHRNPHLLIWLFMNVIIAMIASGSVPIFVYQIIKLKKRFKLELKHLILPALGSIILISMIVILQLELEGLYKPKDLAHSLNIIFNDSEVLKYIGICILLLLSPIFIMIFMIGSAAKRIVFKTKNGLADQSKIEAMSNDFMNLELSLRNGLHVLSSIIVLSVFATGALRESMFEVVEIVGFDIFPIEVTYAYGMFFSLFIGMIYFPVHFYLAQKGKYLRASLQNIEQIEDENESDWKVKILDKLSFKQSVLNNMKVIITVLAPLISTFLPSYLGL